MRSFFIGLTRDPISLLGASIASVVGLLIVSLFTIEMVGLIENHYVGILTYLILPGIFVLGLLLIPIGVRRHRIRERRRKATGKAPAGFPVIDLNLTRTRNIVLTFLALSVVNLVILSTVMVQGVELLEEDLFCGATCHVMTPEWTAFKDSPHAGIDCVNCHVGPGTQGFVTAKLNGVSQVVSTLFGTYDKPTQVPVHNLPTTSATCRDCHRDGRWIGSVSKVITKFDVDEANTELSTVLLLDVGGFRAGVTSGIHWHADPNRQIRFRSDRSRERIWEVELTEPDGSVKRFVSPDATDAASTDSEWRIMDCTDCHSRPAHQFLRPEETVDSAIAEGRIDRTLPFVRREGLRLLQLEHKSNEGARVSIAEGLTQFYRETLPDVAVAKKAEIDAAILALQSGYERNVFPEMDLSWNTYADHGGHEYSTGCFRCHTDLHATADGETISQDCETCHSVLAWDEENPEVLQTLRR